MTEGSVEVDSGVAPTLQNTSEVVDNEQEEADVVEPAATEAEPEGEAPEADPEAEAPTAEGEEPELTDKGTKLDPNPQSRAYQLLANEQRKVQEYQKVLTNPELFKRYAQQAGWDLSQLAGQPKQQEEKPQAKGKLEFKPEDFQSAEDVVQAFNQLQEGFAGQIQGYEQTIQDLQRQVQGLSTTNQVSRVTTNLQQEVSAVQEKYPELNPQSSEYDPELEKEIGQLYHDLDFDPASNLYQGNYSVLQIADRVMRAAGIAKKKGSEAAKTTVKEKKAGKVVTSKKATSKAAPEPNDPGAVIASRIAKAFGN